jgi:hypothetical protein
MQISMIILLVLTSIAVFGRFFINVHIHRHHQRRLRFGADDGFLALGFVCVAVVTAVKLRFLDHIFLSEALTFRTAHLYVPADAGRQLWLMRKWLILYDVLLWVAVCCAKLSLLFFFRQLIRRVGGRLMVYWWLVLAACVALSMHGLLAHFLPCPPLLDAKRSSTFYVFHLALASASSLLPPHPKVSFAVTAAHLRYFELMAPLTARRFLVGGSP